MAVPFVLIDGYNLLHAAGLARVRYAQGDLERLRQRLLGMLGEKLTIAEQMRCTVVFDALSAPADIGISRGRTQEIRVVFAEPGHDADSLIEELIETHPAARQLLVVSSDHRLHKAAKRRGATPIDSDPFWERLRTRPDARTSLLGETPGQPTPSKKPAKPATASTEAWLREFGEISVDDIAAEVVAEDQVSITADEWGRHVSDLERLLADPSEIDRWVNESLATPPDQRSKSRPEGSTRRSDASRKNSPPR